MKRLIYLTICLALLSSCGLSSSTAENKNDIEREENDATNVGFYKLENLNVRSYIKIVTENYNEKEKLNFVTFAGEFPQNWVKSEDIEYLIGIMNSKEKCCGYMNVFSSNMSSENADVGGFALLFINSYRENTKLNFGLNCNPKTDEKSIKEIEDWYRNEYK